MEQKGEDKQERSDQQQQIADQDFSSNGPMLDSLEQRGSIERKHARNSPWCKKRLYDPPATACRFLGKVRFPDPGGKQHPLPSSRGSVIMGVIA